LLVQFDRDGIHKRLETRFLDGDIVRPRFDLNHELTICARRCRLGDKFTLHERYLNP